MKIEYVKIFRRKIKKEEVKKENIEKENIEKENKKVQKEAKDKKNKTLVEQEKRTKEYNERVVREEVIKQKKVNSYISLKSSCIVVVAIIFDFFIFNNNKVTDYTFKETVDNGIAKVTFNVKTYAVFNFNKDNTSFTFNKDNDYKGDHLNAKIVFKKINKKDYFLCLREHKTEKLKVCYYAEGKNLKSIKKFYSIL